VWVSGSLGLGGGLHLYCRKKKYLIEIKKVGEEKGEKSLAGQREGEEGPFVARIQRRFRTICGKECPKLQCKRFSLGEKRNDVIERRGSPGFPARKKKENEI